MEITYSCLTETSAGYSRAHQTRAYTSMLTDSPNNDPLLRRRHSAILPRQKIVKPSSLEKSL